jgi:hypothetical protein
MMRVMTRPRRLRSRLLAPLIYLAAFILLVEDWFWDLGLRLVRFVAAWPPLHALEQRIVRLSPYAALAAFALPAILLFPVKIVCLIAIASGHAFYGVTVILLAKIGGAAIVARMYSLTRPTLLQLAWFARWHDRFMDVKDRWVARLKETDAWRRMSLMAAFMRAAARRTLARFTSRGRLASRPARMMRRFAALWRSRHR